MFQVSLLDRRWPFVENGPKYSRFVFFHQTLYRLYALYLLACHICARETVYISKCKIPGEEGTVLAVVEI